MSSTIRSWISGRERTRPGCGWFDLLQGLLAPPPAPTTLLARG